VQSMLGVGSKFTFKVKVFRTSETVQSPARRTGVKANENSPMDCIDTNDMEIKIDSSRSQKNKHIHRSPADSLNDTRTLVRTGINELDSFPPVHANDSNDRISFQGLTFDMSTSLTTPLEIIQGSFKIDLSLYGKLFDFLKTMETHGKLKHSESAG